MQFGEICFQQLFTKKLNFHSLRPLLNAAAQALLCERPAFCTVPETEPEEMSTQVIPAE